MSIVRRAFRLLSVCAAALLMLTTSPVQASSHIIYVDVDATGAGDGTNWTDAYPTLQAALAAAGSGDQLWVAEGVYYPDEGLSSAPTDPREATFQLIDGVAIYGGFDGSETTLNARDPDTHITVLSGDLAQDDTFDDSGGADPVLTAYGGIVPDATGETGTWANNAENAYHVTTGSGAGASALLSGVTITAGLADSGFPNNAGGGMRNENGSPTLTDVTFSGNAASGGGGVYNDMSNPTLTNVTFSGNASTVGGGMFNTTSNPTLTNVTFSGNASTTVGGGMYSAGGSNPTLTDTIFFGNSAVTSGGGMYSTSSTITLTNGVFSANSAEEGGGMYNFTNSSPTLTNVTFSDNSATTAGGAIFNGSNSNPTIQNSILWGNTASGSGNQVFNDSSTPTFDHSLVEGSGGSTSWDTSLGTDGGNNIDADPLFADADGPDNIAGTLDDDLRPQASSPAIDMGDNTADLDSGGSGTDTIADVPTDLAGSPRIADGPDVDTDATVDMGAYEYIIPPDDSPTNLDATYEAANNEIDLNWTDNTSNETNYTIERQADGGAWAVLDDTVPADSESYTDTDVACETTYDYRVKATNAGGDSAYSNVASASTPSCIPAGPSDLTATYSAANHQVELAWTDNSPIEEGFIIERQKDGATGWETLTMTAADATSYTDETATCDQNYVYRVTATNSAGASAPAASNVVDTSCAIFDDLTALPAPFMEPWVEDFFRAGITTGKADCTASPDPGPGETFYCGSDPVTRADMAVFIIRALEYGNLPYTPTGTTPDPFSDVPADLPAPFMEDWVEEFLRLSVTTGKGQCDSTGKIGPDLYCPADNVTRADMAVFILRALGTPEQDVSPDLFADVPVDLPAPFMEPFVETFFTEGITTGKGQCDSTGKSGPDLYCPQDNVTRADMAVFILRAFDSIPDPNDP